MFGVPAHQFGTDRPAGVGIIIGGIGDRPAIVAKLLREMAHGREQEGDLLAMVADIGRLVADLGHDHDVAVTVGGGQRRQRRRQLVAQDEDKTRRYHGTGSKA